MELLDNHEKSTPDQLWSAEDGAGPLWVNEADLPKLKLVTSWTKKGLKPGFPPRSTRLSDELVYLATKFLRAKDRGKLYPYDFFPQGDIRPERVPSDPCPIVFAHGLPFFPVFKGYYVLCGRQHAPWIGWILHPRIHSAIKGFPYWTIGPVVAPGTAVALERTIERQLHVHKPASMEECERGIERQQCARDVVSKNHADGSVVPLTSTGGFVVSELYHVPGYNVRCGPPLTNGRRADRIGRKWYRDNEVHSFDYDRASKKYSNQRNPRVVSYDDPHGWNDEKNDKEEVEDSEMNDREEVEDIEMNGEEGNDSDDEEGDGSDTPMSYGEDDEDDSDDEEEHGSNTPTSDKEDEAEDGAGTPMSDEGEGDSGEALDQHPHGHKNYSVKKLPEQSSDDANDADDEMDESSHNDGWHTPMNDEGEEGSESRASGLEEAPHHSHGHKSYGVKTVPGMTTDGTVDAKALEEALERLELEYEEAESTEMTPSKCYRKPGAVRKDSAITVAKGSATSTSMPIEIEKTNSAAQQEHVDSAVEEFYDAQEFHDAG